MNPLTATKSARDAALVLIRIALGVLMIQHARMEYDYSGGSVDGVVKGFDASGVPLPELSARFNLLIEFVGGFAIIAGLAVPIVGILMAANMLGAWIFVHWGPDLYDPAGPAMVIAIGIVSLALVVTGAGRVSIDHLMLHRTRWGARVTQAQTKALVNA